MSSRQSPSRRTAPHRPARDRNGRANREGWTVQPQVQKALTHMRTFAITTGLTLGGAAVAGIVGVVAAAFVDTGSAVVISVVVALGLLVIGLIEWTHRRRHDRSVTVRAGGQHRGTHRALDEVRAARAGTGHTAVSHALRSV